MFLTDSVFAVLLACFDETMDCIGGCKPWESESTVPIMQNKILMGFEQYL